MLSPSNQQIAHGTALQYRLRQLQPSGQVVDLTQKGVWQVLAADGRVLQQAEAGAGLVAPAEPGQYRVSASYDGRTVATAVFVTAATLKSLAVSPTAPKVAKGLTQQFTATATFSDGTTQDVTALSSWSIKDTTGTGVAGINSRGLATARSIGKARITARYLTASATATLEVTAATLRTLALSPLTPAAAKGTAQRFTATGTFSDGTVQDVTSSADWAVMDLTGSGVASIDGTGTALAESVGQARVSAEYLGQVVQTTLTVTPAAVVALAVSPLAPAVAKGITQQFVATAHLTDGSDQDVSASAAWTAADLVGSGVASVDAAGLARGNAVGSASISCAYQGFSATTTLQVKPAALVAIAITPAAATVARGLAQTFKLVASYTDGTVQDATTSAVWSAADVVGSDVASITAGGVALGKNLGQAQVKAEHLGKTATATLTVTAAALVSLAVTPASPAIAVGATQQFKALGSYTDGTTLDHSAAAAWSATDVAPATGVATISTSGLATAKGKGVALIAATYLGVRGQATLAVGQPPGLCSPDGWCWRNPLPQGNYMPAVWASDANNVWAVSDFGAIVRWNGSAWLAQASGTTQNLLGVWGSDTNNVWAVGVGGVIVKWNGTAWSAQASGTTQNLSAVWGTDASNVWAVGASGVIVKWNGTAWTTQTSGSTQYLRGIWGSSATSVWVVGAGGIILKWDGTAWSAQASGTFQYLRSIWGTDASNLWAVGLSGTILSGDCDLPSRTYTDSRMEIPCQ
ncbi:MAG TPA: Ig-like domain-containing protein [Pseudomonadota bacterium]|nr:Ig-like domain-containing protein [Pseudomonadota bacterium]